MPCFHPLDASRAFSARENKHVVRVRPKDVSKWKWLRDTGSTFMSLACGQCRGCRLERSRQWAVRCVHEASLYEDNCFITLTYDRDNLPADLSLNKVHFQLFMKRLRRFFGDRRIRFYHCGEYGGETLRPHYHALLFNLDFDDKVVWKEERGNVYYRSECLEERWGHGMCLIGEVTFESAAYVARYIMKKVNGAKARDKYLRCDDDGVASFVSPEYTTMSRNTGIGRGWLDEFGAEVFPSDEVIVNGHSCPPPRYYTDVFSEFEPEMIQAVKAKRQVWFSAHDADCTPERLADREICLEARMGRLEREL